MINALQRSSLSPTCKDKSGFPLPPFLFAIQILDLFGENYAAMVKGSVSSHKEFQETRNAFIEMQQKLRQGNGYFAEVTHPRTATVLNRFSVDHNHLEVFSDLKEKSYRILPFPQKLLSYENPDKSALQKLEETRDKGLQLCLLLLSPYSQTPVDWSDEDRRILTKFYFGTGALIYKGETVYFSELIQTWLQFNSKNEENHHRVTTRLLLRDWIERPPQTINAFKSYSPNGKDTFRAFLEYCSLIALAEHLNCTFLPRAALELGRKLTNERVRSDLCYLSAYGLDAIDLSDRPSGPLIHLFRFYADLCSHIPEEEQASLLSILLFTNAKLPDFREIDVPAFRTAWSCFQQIIAAISRYGDVEELISDRNAWDLLYFLCQSELRVHFSALIEQLYTTSNFAVSIADCLAFFRSNETGCTSERCLGFILMYKETIEYLKLHGIVLNHPQVLGFTPPCPLNVQMKKGVERIVPQLRSFKNMDRMGLILRQFIVRPQMIIFDLLEDCRQVGAKLDEEFLFAALSKEQTLSEPLTEDVRSDAKDLMRRMQARYQFKNEQIFPLYISLLGLSEDKIRIIAQVVDDLINFCPTVSPSMIYYLFRYRPEVTPADLSPIVRMREAWAHNEEELNRFVIDQALYHSILDAISAYARPLSLVSEEEGDKFFVECQTALLSAFFPPVQPLTDYFHITGVTEKGIQWKEGPWHTHEGRLKSVLRDSPLKVYFHWYLCHEQPVFFFSFFDTRTGTANSANISFNGSFERLSEMGPKVLQEETEPNFTEEDVPWEFLHKVKVAYRKAFLGRRLDEVPSAAMGHIFPAHPRGSLLPKALLDLEQHPEHFLPDLPLSMLDQIPNSFYLNVCPHLVVCTVKDEEEGKLVTMSLLGREVSLFYPQTLSQLCLYFDFQNLMLKARFFRDLQNGRGYPGFFLLETYVAKPKILPLDDLPVL